MPIIKAVIKGVDIDFAFATVNREKVCECPACRINSSWEAYCPTTQVPVDLDLTDDRILVGADERNARSLNGSRVTDSMLNLVPDVETFRDTLRAIKVWAKRQFSTRRAQSDLSLAKLSRRLQSERSIQTSLGFWEVCNGLYW